MLPLLIRTRVILVLGTTAEERLCCYATPHSPVVETQSLMYISL